MPAKAPISGQRRSHLAMLTLAPLIGCKASMPVTRVVAAPGQKPQSFALLPVRPAGLVQLNQLPAARGFSGGFGGLSRTALWGGHGSNSRDFTRVLNQNGLMASRYLIDQLIARSTSNRIDLIHLGNAAAPQDALSERKPELFAYAADAVLSVEIIGLAYTATSANAYWPKIDVTMKVASTRDNGELGDRQYQVRPNAQRADQRDIKPQALARFASVNELMANPRLVVKMLHIELNRVAQLMVSDLKGLTQGRAMQWGAV